VVGCLSFLRIDLVLEGANVAFYPLDGGLESLLSLAIARFTCTTLVYGYSVRLCQKMYMRLTYVDVFGQELVRHAVFVNDVVVHARAGCCRTEKETEQATMC
jgi:hypothetical protein